MAEAVGGTILGKIFDYAFAPISRQFTYMFCFKSNIKELEEKFEEFKATIQEVEMTVNEDRTKGRVIGPTVMRWLESANKVTSEVDAIIQDKPRVKEWCLNGWCPNLKLRYSVSRKAVKKTKIVSDLQAAGVRHTKSSHSPPPVCTQTIPNRDFTQVESRRLNIEEIIMALKHDKINLVGVCGMGGVGKTIMVQEVAKRAKEDDQFDEVSFVAVGQYPDLTKVQNCIADQFGLTDLKKHDDAMTRASLLRSRLLQDKKRILLILDDIWDEFRLEDHGIPLESSQETFKILYTSRSQHLWHDIPTKTEIMVEVLPKDEAWQLFRDKAGVSVDAPELQPIAKQIVDQCGCLPLALVTIGSTLLKTSGRNLVKEIWEDILNQLTSRSGTVAEHLSSCLELSYEYLEDKEAKHLFLLCCLFEEDENILIEDLVRYGVGLSLFNGIDELTKVRDRVFRLVDDLKSRYLLLDGDDEFVIVHDAVRGMGISIASKDKSTLVSHGAVTKWPKKETFDRYAHISVVSRQIEELPEGLTCQNLEFLLLKCSSIFEKHKLPCNNFEGMEKLKVLAVHNFYGIVTVQSLRNLQALSLEGCRGDLLGNASGLGGLLNLEILSFQGSRIEELPEEIGGLVKLRLLDLEHTRSLKRIPAGVISRLVRLEELYIVSSNFRFWEGDGNEKGRNTNLREFESLTNLCTLEISIKAGTLLPKSPIFSSLKKFKVLIYSKYMDKIVLPFNEGCKTQLAVHSSPPLALDRGGIDLLLRSADDLSLECEGCSDLVRKLVSQVGVDGCPKLKYLLIRNCDTPESFANSLYPVQQPTVFPILKNLNFWGLKNLSALFPGPVPAGSFGEITEIDVRGCVRLVNLFRLPIVLPQLTRLFIWGCRMMDQVLIWTERQQDVRVASNKIEFPKLKSLVLWDVGITDFCTGIDEIDFPQLKSLCLSFLPRFRNNIKSSNSEQNHKFGFLSIFPPKATFPLLESVEVRGWQNVSNIWGSELPAFTFSKLNQLTVEDCESLSEIFNPSMARVLVNLRNLTISRCLAMEAVVGREEEVEEGQGRKPDKILFPQLQVLRVWRLPNLRRFCHFTHPIELPLLSKIFVAECPRMEAFSLGQVSAPCFSFTDVSWNGDLNHAIQLMLEGNFIHLFHQVHDCKQLQKNHYNELASL